MSENNTKNGRNERIDLYKGILMFGVIWGHMITNLLAGDENTIGIHLIVRTYDMPMFMLLSGYFLAFSMKNKNWKTLIKSRFMRIMIPTLFWGMLITHGNPFQTLYFLYAIFLSITIVSIVGKLVDSIQIQIIIFLTISIALNFVPLDLWNLSYLFPFFALGYEANVLNIHVKKWLGGAFLLWIMALCFWKVNYSVWSTGTFLVHYDTHAIFVFVFRYAIGIVGILSAILLCNIIYAYYSIHRGYIYEIILKCGRETLLLYILQDIVLFKFVKHGMLFVVKKIGYNPLNFNETFLGYFIAPLCTFFLIVFLLLLADYAKKYKTTKLLFGY